MCITVNKAALTKTKILSLPLENGNHFIAYSNAVKNLSGKPNAMILPIPGTTKQEWFHNTEKYRDFLEQITEKARFQDDWLGNRSRGMKGLLSYESFKLGMYTIGLASSYEGAEEFMMTMPEDQRPEVSKGLADFFREKYAGWSFAVCCFDSENTIDAQPIAFEYTPFDPDMIYFPTLDAHDGGAPDMTRKVQTDHTFIYEHTGKFENQLETSRYNGVVRPKYAMEFITLSGMGVPDFLNKRKYRLCFSKGREENGDTYIDQRELRSMSFDENAREFRKAPNGKKKATAQ